jgi:hypothetical protein
MIDWIGNVAVFGAGVAVAVGRLMWIAGLVLALRGSAPHERPAILRAYATCQSGHRTERDSATHQFYELSQLPPASWWRSR